jgi:hypothetical protein
MPQPHKYASAAHRQAAYFRRTRQAQADLLIKRGIPSLPPIPSMPGTARWASAIRQSRTLLDMVCEEMQDYHNDRSETWKESEKCDDFIERMEAVQELRDQFDAISD